MPLNIRTEPLENRRLSLIVEVDQERVDEELRKAARSVGGQYRIPGFRKGKAPYSVVVQYVGLPNLYSEFIDSLGNELYVKAVEQAEIEPYAMASLDISSLEPLVYNFEVPLEPTVDLGDYRSLRIEEEEQEVTDEEVDERLQALREQMAGWTEVERPSEYGDMLTIDIRSTLQVEAGDEDTSEETIVLDETDWDVTLDEENPMEPAGLDVELIGLLPGAEKEFVLGWPEDSQSIYAGKQADFKVTLHTVQANMEPELDDDFAKKVDEKFETLEDLKASIHDAILEEKQLDAASQYAESVLDALVEQSEMDYPPVVVEDQIDSMVGEFSRQLRMYGIESLETYLSQTGQSIDEYRETMREQAEIAALRNLVISELYQKEGITVSDEEVERIEAVVANFGGDEATDEQAEMAKMLAENMRSGQGRTVLESQIIQEKSLERLLAIARGEEVPEPGAPVSESEDDEGTDETEQAEIEATAESAAIEDEIVEASEEEADSVTDSDQESSEEDEEKQE